MNLGQASTSEELGILFVSKDSPDPYGSTKSFLSVAEHFRARGCRLAMFTFPKGFLDRKAEEWGIPRDGFTFRWMNRGTSFGRVFALFSEKLTVLWMVFCILRRGRYQLLYINTTTHISPLLAAWLLGRKTVVHVREGSDYFQTAGSRKRRLINGVRNAIMRRCANRFFCVSQYVADTVNRSLSIDRAEAIYNGIDVDLFRRTDEDRQAARSRLGFGDSDFVIIAAGRMHGEKAMGTFVEAGIVASRGVPGIRVIAIGGPHDTPYFFNHIKPLADSAPAGLVATPGYCSNMREYYAAADVFVHPAAYDEPLARTILEAMAMQCCIIATAVGGTPEMIEEGQNGFLVAPNDVGGLADKIVELAFAPELREKCAQAARATVETRFTVERYISEINTRVNELVGPSGSRL